MGIPELTPVPLHYFEAFRNGFMEWALDIADFFFHVLGSLGG